MNVGEIIGKVILDTNKAILTLIKPRTVFTILFFGTTSYLIIVGLKVPELLKTIDVALLAFYFGEKSTKYINGKENK